MASDLRRIDPPRVVQVQLDDGRWVEGFQDAWVRQSDGSWRASVSYRLDHEWGRGTHLAALPPERVRLAAILDSVKEL
ncbi:hypothetical protein [Geodermatophilus africanus]|nr:hypothetical protein [Geodermatophilus africanus]